PRLDQLIITDSGKTVDFSVPVSSEDAGDALYAALFVDFSPGDDPERSLKLPASTLDEGERTLHLSWRARADIKPGCHRITLLVTHLSNWITGADVVNKADLDEAYWFANITS